jgi:hypothetical protein
MQGLMKMMPDGHYDLKCWAADPERQRHPLRPSSGRTPTPAAHRRPACADLLRLPSVGCNQAPHRRKLPAEQALQAHHAVIDYEVAPAPAAAAGVAGPHDIWVGDIASICRLAAHHALAVEGR